MKPHCWWCCHSFDGESLHWPYKFKSNVFSTTGHFCSWSCIKSYAFDKGKTETFEFIVLMKKRMGGGMTPIKRAPKRECLVTFGGSITIDQFRENTKPIFVHIPDEYYQMPIITNTLLSAPVSIQNGTELQLKRSKPLERSKGKLEKALTKCSNAAKNGKNLNSVTEQKS